MRILYHHRTLADGAEGVHIGAMVGAFRALGHEVRVIGMTADPANARRRSWLGRARQAMPQALLELAALTVNGPEYAATVREIRAFKPDLFYKRHARFDFGAMLAARRRKVPSALEVNCLFTREPYVLFEPLALRRVAAAVERWTLGLSTVVVTVSSPLARQARLMTTRPVVVEPNGADADRFNAAAARGAAVRARHALDTGTVVGWVGVLREWHGLEILLDAIGGVADLRLLVVGDGPGRAEVERRAAELGIGQRVIVTGRVPHDQMPDYLAAMDIAVVADERTGVASPMKLLEYMAMGLAVVAPAMDNISDVVTDGVNGCLFRAGDKDQLRAALQRLAADAALRRALGEAAKAEVTTSRTWIHVASRVLAAAQREA